MNKYDKPEFTEEDLGSNPFINALIIPVNVLEEKGVYIRDEDGIVVNREIELEAARSTKFYYSTEKRLKINKLSDKAQRLMLWLMSSLKTSKDYIYINRLRYAEENEIKSKVTISNAITELHKFGLIAPTPVRSVYWINPEYIFAGSRVNKYNNRVKNKLSKRKKIEAVA